MSYGGRAEEEKGRRCPGLRGDNKYGSGCHGNAFLFDNKAPKVQFYFGNISTAGESGGV